MNGLGRDIRYALRQFRKSPGFTAVALLTLALGLGVNCTLFSVVNAVLLEPLPYPSPERLVVFDRTFPGDFTYQTSATKFIYWRDHAKGFEAVAAQDLLGGGINLTGSGEPERLKSLAVTAEFFRTLGVQPSLGRAFTESEDRPDGPRSVVLSYGLWARRFASDPGIVGKSLRLGNELYTVVGISSPRFAFTPAVDLWIPLRVASDPSHAETTYRVFGRLRAGVTLAQAQQEMAAVGREFQRQYPEQMRPDESVSVMGYQESLVREMRLPLLLLQAAVGFVLLIVCANLANLMLSRSLVRRKEMALRAALGAGRRLLVRQLMVESVLLAFVGGGLGLALATLMLPMLLRLGPRGISPLAQVHIDAHVWIFAALVATASAVVFGTVPALQSASTSPNEILKENSGRGSGSRTAGRIQELLVVAEVSLSAVLLVGAGLLIQTFYRLQNEDPGFDPHRVVIAQTTLDDARFRRTQAVTELQEQALARLQGSPGVEAAATISTLPTEPSPQTDFLIEGDPKQGDLNGITAWRSISPRYFDVMRIPVLQGRGFTSRDTATAPGSVVVNQSLVKRFFPGRNPIGAQIMIGQRFGSVFKDRPREIVGVVGDTREDGLDQPAPPALFVPSAQVPDAITVLFNRMLPLNWVIRGRDQSSAAQTMRHELLAVASQQPIANLQSAEQLLRASITRQRFSMWLVTLFACLALLLGCIGLYGVLSFVVAQRTKELGIRISLGALKRDVLWLVLRHGMLWVLVGVAIGAAASVGLTRLMASLLYGVTPSDVPTLAAVAFLIVLVALFACYIPARRATKVDPMVALRYE